MPNTYAPKIPFETDEKDNFIYISDLLQNAKQKLKMILLTSPGEKIYDPEFGIGIHRYIFEPNSGVITVKDDKKTILITDFKSDLYNKINKQIIKYGVDVNIENISVVSNDISLKVVLDYNYSGYISDSLTVSIGT